MTSTDRLNGVNDGLAIKVPVVCATTANITLSGLQTIDGVTVVAGDRVLVKNQTTGANNGIYNASSGVWERAKDFDGNRDVVGGTLIPVRSGTTNGGAIYRVTNTSSITIGTTTLTFASTVWTFTAAPGYNINFTASAGNSIVFNTDGGSPYINTAGQYRSLEQGNVFGVANGTMATPSSSTTNLMLYYNSETSYGGLAADSSGNLYLVSGTSSPAARVSVGVNSGAVRLWGYGAGTLTTDASGNVTATSDGTLKNITGTFTRGLSAVLSLSPVMYSWREDSGMDPEGEYAGLIAQDVQKLIPEAVGAMPNGKLTLSDRPLIMALVNSIKELAGDLAAVRAELAEIRKGG